MAYVPAPAGDHRPAMSAVWATSNAIHLNEIVILVAAVIGPFRQLREPAGVFFHRRRAEAAIPCTRSRVTEICPFITTTMIAALRLAGMFCSKGACQSFGASYGFRRGDDCRVGRESECPTDNLVDVGCVYGESSVTS